MLIGVSGLIGSGKDAVSECIQALDCWYNQYGNKLAEFEDYEDIQFCKSILEGKTESHKVFSSWKNKKFATKIKQIAAILFDCEPNDFENIRFKNSALPQEWQVEGEPTRTYRHALQMIGTDCIRNHYNQNTWVLSMFNTYNANTTKYPDRNYSNICSICGKTEYYCDKHMTICRECFTKQSYPNWVISDVRFSNEINAIKERGGYMIRVDRGYPTVNHISEIEWQSYKDWDFIIDNNGDYEHLIRQVKDIMVSLDLLKLK
jgi:ribosomal protein S14